MLCAMAAVVSGCDSGGAASGCPELTGEALEAWGDAGFSGTIAVSSGDEVDCVESVGLADRERYTANTADTVFSIGSVSKAFTAAAVLALVDDGSLTLDDRAGDLVPDALRSGRRRQRRATAAPHERPHRIARQRSRPLTRDQARRRDQWPGARLRARNRVPLLERRLHVAGADRRGGVGHDLPGFPRSRILPLPTAHVAGGFWDGEPAAPGPRRSATSMTVRPTRWATSTGRTGRSPATGIWP